ncbi:hypothetical protein [Exercitatus varius]|nr:hypothetical protein [Exercitatus varius]
MTTEINETGNTNKELTATIEEKRTEIKERFGISDEEFDLLIRNVILDSFDKLKVRLSVDDPIFAVVLTQKNVMDYYVTMITNALNELPKRISYTLDDRIESLGETISNISEAFDSELNSFKNDFSSQVFELNNQIVANFSTFIDKKLEEIKTALESVKIATPTVEPKKASKSPINALILAFTAINIAIAGLTLFTVHKSTSNSKEVAYQMGLFKGFEQVRKTFSPKDAERVQSIVIESIDNELKARQ